MPKVVRQYVLLSIYAMALCFSSDLVLQLPKVKSGLTTIVLVLLYSILLIALCCFPFVHKGYIALFGTKRAKNIHTIQRLFTFAFSIFGIWLLVSMDTILEEPGKAGMISTMVIVVVAVDIVHSHIIRRASRR